MPGFITRWVLWDQESFLLTLWVSSNRNLTSVWYYYSIRRLNLHSPGFFVGSNTYHFSDKRPLSQLWQGGRYFCRGTDKWFPWEVKVPSGSRQNFSMNIKMKRKPPNCKGFVAKNQKALPQELNLHVTLQTCTRDCSSSQSQVASKVETGYNKATSSQPSEQFLAPFVTEVRAPTGLNPIIPVEIWDRMNLFHMSLPNPGW